MLVRGASARQVAHVRPEESHSELRISFRYRPSSRDRSSLTNARIAASCTASGGLEMFPA